MVNKRKSKQDFCFKLYYRQFESTYTNLDFRALFKIYPTRRITLQLCKNTFIVGRRTLVQFRLINFCDLVEFFLNLLSSDTDCVLRWTFNINIDQCKNKFVHKLKLSTQTLRYIYTVITEFVFYVTFKIFTILLDMKSQISIDYVFTDQFNRSKKMLAHFRGIP